MKVLIIDDEISAIDTIKTYLKEYFSSLQILGYAQSVSEGIEQIKSSKPDLVFLDIELTDGTGFDIIRAFSNPLFKVIFITAYDKFALQAFRFSAIDYILKPVDPKDFKEAVNKALVHEASRDQQVELVTLLHNLSTASQVSKRIVLRTSEDIHLVSTSELIRIESDGAYSHFILDGNRRLTVSQNIKNYDEMLAGYGFLRCHQSHMVNSAFISRFHKADGGILVLKDGSKIPVSFRKKEAVIRLIEKIGNH